MYTYCIKGNEKETLADLANDHKFAKVFLAKILSSILNIVINQIRQMCFVVN